MSAERAAQLVEAGIWLKLSGDLEGATKLFERALKLDPDNAQALAQLAGAEAPPMTDAPPAVGGSSSSTPPQPSAPDLDGDWGRFAGAPSPVPQIPPVTMAWSRSGTMRLYPEPESKPGTMQMFPEKKAKTTQLFLEKPEVPAPRTTLPQFSRDAVLEAPPAPQPMSAPPAPRTTVPQFSRDIVLGEAPPAPRATLMDFGQNVVLGEAPAEPQLPVVTAPSPAPVPSSDSGTAWGWTPSADDYTRPLEPRPSPSLAPRAESAWDQRSNPGIKLEIEPDGRALDLIVSDSKITRAPPTTKDELKIVLRGAKDLLDLDDHTGAMELITRAIALAPDDPEVISLKDRSEATLLRMFESKIGKLEATPRVLLKDDEIIWLNLDHRAGFVLAQIDGTVSFDDLFSVSGMSRMDTARILAQLIDEGVISRG